MAQMEFNTLSHMFYLRFHLSVISTVQVACRAQALVGVDLGSGGLAGGVGGALEGEDGSL